MTSSLSTGLGHAQDRNMGMLKNRQLREVVGRCRELAWVGEAHRNLAETV